jgi:adenosylhomocysteine nucleosidase
MAVIVALPQETRGLFDVDGIQIYYSGIGKINAAICATEVILTTSCKKILNLGTAGSHKFKPHTLVECSAFVQRDMDLTPLGFALGQTPLDPISGRIDVPTFLPDLPKGVCGTGDVFETGAPKVSCDLVDMEAYAIAKICNKKGIEFSALKYITDGSDANAHLDWKANLVPASQRLFEIFQKHFI